MGFNTSQTRTYAFRGTWNGNTNTCGICDDGRLLIAVFCLPIAMNSDTNVQNINLAALMVRRREPVVRKLIIINDYLMKQLSHLNCLGNYIVHAKNCDKNVDNLQTNVFLETNDRSKFYEADRSLY